MLVPSLWTILLRAEWADSNCNWSTLLKSPLPLPQALPRLNGIHYQQSIEKQYQKSLNAFNFYWQAMLMCTWSNMIEKNTLLGEKLATAKNRGKEHLVAGLRFASLTINSNILNRMIKLNDISN